MNRNTLLTTVTAAAVALLIGLTSPQAAQAQRQGGGGRGGFGGFGAPFGMGRMGGMNDPTRSSAMMLLQRDDVQSHLMITARQREALQDMQNKAMTEFQQKMQANRPDFQSLRNLSPEERQTKIQEMQQQMQQTMQSFQEDLDKKTEAILKPAQVKRLHELDLQWRGPLAIADPKVGDQLDLSQEQKGKLGEILTEFRTKQQEAMRSAFGGFGGRGRRNRNNNGDPNGNANGDPNAGAGQQDGNAPPQRPDPQQMQARFAEAQKEIEKIKKESSAKVLELLAPEQKQKWDDLVGKKFTFRATSSQSGQPQ